MDTATNQPALYTVFSLAGRWCKWCTAPHCPHTAPLITITLLTVPCCRAPAPRCRTPSAWCCPASRWPPPSPTWTTSWRRQPGTRPLLAGGVQTLHPAPGCRGRGRLRPLPPARDQRRARRRPGQRKQPRGETVPGRGHGGGHEPGQHRVRVLALQPPRAQPVIQTVQESTKEFRKGWILAAIKERICEF